MNKIVTDLLRFQPGGYLINVLPDNIYTLPCNQNLNMKLICYVLLGVAQVENIIIIFPLSNQVTKFVGHFTDILLEDLKLFKESAIHCRRKHTIQDDVVTNYKAYAHIPKLITC